MEIRKKNFFLFLFFFLLLKWKLLLILDGNDAQSLFLRFLKNNNKWQSINSSENEVINESRILYSVHKLLGDNSVHIWQNIYGICLLLLFDCHMFSCVDVSCFGFLLRWSKIVHNSKFVHLIGSKFLFFVILLNSFILTKKNSKTIVKLKNLKQSTRK